MLNSYRRFTTKGLKRDLLGKVYLQNTRSGIISHKVVWISRSIFQPQKVRVTLASSHRVFIWRLDLEDFIHQIIMSPDTFEDRRKTCKSIHPEQERRGQRRAEHYQKPPPLPAKTA